MSIREIMKQCIRNAFVIEGSDISPNTGDAEAKSNIDEAVRDIQKLRPKKDYSLICGKRTSFSSGHNNCIDRINEKMFKGETIIEAIEEQKDRLWFEKKNIMKTIWKMMKKKLREPKIMDIIRRVCFGKDDNILFKGKNK